MKFALAFPDLLSECVELLFEGRSPSDAIFSLLLTVLDGHVSSVFKKSNKPLHVMLAPVFGQDAVFSSDFVLLQHSLTEILLGLRVEPFSGLARIVINCASSALSRQSGKLRVTCL